MKSITAPQKCIFIVLILLTAPFTSVAQHTADHIKNLKKEVYSHWEKQDFAGAEASARKGLAESRKYQIDSMAGDFLVLIGAIAQVKNDYSVAIANYLEAIPHYQKEGKQGRVATAYLNIGSCKIKMSDFATANDYLFKAVEQYERLNDRDGLSSAYSSIGVSFVSLNEPQKAVIYARKALQLRWQLKDQVLIAQSLNNLGLAFKSAKQRDSAIFYFYKCLKMREKEKDSSRLVLLLQNIGALYIEEKSLAKAEPFIVRSLKIAAQFEMKEEIAKGHIDLAKMLFYRREYVQAINSLEKARSIAVNLKTPEIMMKADELLYQIHAEQGDFKKALQAGERRNAARDSMFSLAKNKAIAELEIRYEAAQKEKDIKTLSIRNNLQQKIVKQQEQSIIFLIFGTLLLAVLFAFAYYNYRLKNKANHRVQTLMQDLHHRVKNNLQILSGLFIMQINDAQDDHTRNALRENESRLVSMNLIHNELYQQRSDTKIEMKAYLSKLLEHIRISFNGLQDKKIGLNIAVEEIELEADIAVAIGLIVNELITNAFKYAFSDSAGEISLRLERVNKSTLFLAVSDNGMGMKVTDQQSSFGLKLVNLMARQLNAELVADYSEGVSYHMNIKL